MTDVHVWELERRVFQTVMMRTAIRRLEDNLAFLRSVPLLAKLSRDKLVKMADVIETVSAAWLDLVVGKITANGVIN